MLLLVGVSAHRRWPGRARPRKDRAGGSLFANRRQSPGSSRTTRAAPESARLSAETRPLSSGSAGRLRPGPGELLGLLRPTERPARAELRLARAIFRPSSRGEQGSKAERSRQARDARVSTVSLRRMLRGNYSQAEKSNQGMLPHPLERWSYAFCLPFARGSANVNRRAAPEAGRPNVRWGPR